MSAGGVLVVILHVWGWAPIIAVLDAGAVSMTKLLHSTRTAVTAARLRDSEEPCAAWDPFAVLLNG